LVPRPTLGQTRLLPRSGIGVDGEWLVVGSSNDSITCLDARLLNRIELGASHGLLLVLGDVEVDLSKKLVTRQGKPVRLTPTEYQLVHAFVTHPGKLLTQRWLLNTVWGRGYDEETNVRVHVGHLRRKLEEDPSNPRLILTEPGLGYRWAENELPDGAGYVSRVDELPSS